MNTKRIMINVNVENNVMFDCALKETFKAFTIKP